MAQIEKERLTVYIEFEGIFQQKHNLGDLTINFFASSALRGLNKDI